MPPGGFTGADFRLEEVNPIGLATVRVRYTQDPLLSTGLTGALNIDNYLITGPSLNYVTGASQVLADPQAVDLYLAVPLDLGVWNVSVSNVLMENATDPLQPPTALSFVVEKISAEEPVPKGAVNDEVVNVLRKHFNPALKGKGWDSLLQGLAPGDKMNWDNAKLAFDQLFLASASGVYLDRRASDQGVRRPPAVAMPDDLFRDLAIISKTSKLTQDAILETLEVFYGSEAVRATLTTSLEEPFALEDTDELQLLLDERDQINVVFDRSQFGRIGEATAVEVAAAISRQLHSAGSAAFAVAHRNEFGNVDVRIYSGRLGISSAIRVLGGKAQTNLLFTSGNSDPDFIFAASGIAPFARWDVTVSSTQGRMRFTLDGASATFNDFNALVEGDRVLIYGQEFSPANRGTFEIVQVGVEYPGPSQWFEVENSAGVAQANVDQAFYQSLQFHRSRKRTVYNEPRHVIVSQREGQVDVIIPATTQAVRRRPRIAAYANLRAPVGLDSLQRGFNPTYGGDHVLVDAPSHGLSVGDMLLIDNAFPSMPEAPPIVLGAPATLDGFAVHKWFSGNGFILNTFFSAMFGSDAIHKFDDFPEFTTITPRVVGEIISGAAPVTFQVRTATTSGGSFTPFMTLAPVTGPGFFTAVGPETAIPVGRFNYKWYVMVDSGSASIGSVSIFLELK